MSHFVTFALIPQWLRLRNLAARQRSIGRGVSSARKYTAMKKHHALVNDAGVGYKTVAEIINGFVQLNQLPESLSSLVGFWDDGDGIYETFVRHRALWHVSCKQRLVHGTKLDRLRSRIADTGDAELATDADNSEEAGDVSCSKIPRLTRSAFNVTMSTTDTDSVCFFCDCIGTELRQVLTFAVDEKKVHRCATVLGDSLLLGKLAKGDMIATEAKYHTSCLLSLYYKAGQRKQSPMEDDVVPYHCDKESQALAEVISYMEDAERSETTPTVFKLGELLKLYDSYLSKHKIEQHAKVNSTRFKERLLENLPNLTA